MHQAETGRPGAQVLDLLDQHIGVMETLLTCLNLERDALQSRDVDQLLDITQRKNGSLAEVARIDERRKALAYPPENAGSDELDTEVVRRKQQLAGLVEACREINDANGVMIRWQSRRVGNTLRLLRGDRDDAGVYGANGKAGPGNSIRRLLTFV